MQPQLSLLLLLLLLASSCWAAVHHQPRQLLRCPSEFETLVEPLPDSVGDPVLLMGPGVQLRTVGFLQDGVLRVESDRLVLGASTADLRGPYSGPHVLLCSDAEQTTLVTFSLFIQLTADGAEAVTDGAPVDTTVDPASHPTDSLTGHSTDRPTAHPTVYSSAHPTTHPTTHLTDSTASPTDLRLLAFSITSCLLLVICIGLAVSLAVALRRGKPAAAPNRQRRQVYTGPSCDSLLSGHSQCCASLPSLPVNCV